MLKKRKHITMRAGNNGLYYLFAGVVFVSCQKSKVFLCLHLRLCWCCVNKRVASAMRGGKGFTRESQGMFFENVFGGPPHSSVPLNSCTMRYIGTALFDWPAPLLAYVNARTSELPTAAAIYRMRPLSYKEVYKGKTDFFFNQNWTGLSQKIIINI